MTFNPNSIQLDVPFDSNGYSVTIWHDRDAANPWAEWDCQTPVAWVSADRGSRIQSLDSGDNILNFFRSVTPEWAAANSNSIESIFGFQSDVFAEEVAEHAVNYGVSDSQARYDLYWDTLADLVNATGWSPVREALQVLQSLYTLNGVKAVTGTRNGYSQGDSMAFLLVATPEHLARCGGDPAIVASDLSLKNDADLLAAWMWGDVYGFTVEHPSKDEEMADSCGGFYGLYYTEDSGLLDAIRDATSSPALKK
jgi:hypothetical protein